MSSDPTGTSGTSAEKTNGESEDDNVLNIAVDCTKKVVIYTLVYLLGYFGFSISWIYCVLIVVFFSERGSKERQAKWRIARAMALGFEKDIILKKMEHVPSWVNFPDVERAEWLNRIIKQAWPRVNHYAKNLFPTLVEPVVQSYLKGFKFDQVILGHVPFRIDGIKVYDEDTSKNKVVMDVDISYAGDCRITFLATGMKGGIENFQVKGRLRVVMKPLVSTIPIIGGLQCYFMTEPEIDFDLVGMAQILAMPGLRNVLQHSVLEAINSMLLFPNFYSIQLCNDVGTAELKIFEPEGILRVHVVEAKHLMKKDIGLMGSGNSDPYAVLSVGPHKFKTHIIDKTVEPKWDYWCEFEVESNSTLDVHVWDHDDGSKDETLGNAKLSVRYIARKGQDDRLIPLQGVMHGMIRLRFTWLALTSDRNDLDAALKETQEIGAFLHTALLIVYLDSAKNLQKPKQSTFPDPFVQVLVDKTRKGTKPASHTCNPVWEQGFTFMVADPSNAVLSLKIVDKKSESDMGEVTYKVSNLFERPDLELSNHSFLLSKTGSGPECTILVSLKLRIFKNENTNLLEEKPVEPIAPIPVQEAPVIQEYNPAVVKSSIRNLVLNKQESSTSLRSIASGTFDSDSDDKSPNGSLKDEDSETVLTPRNSTASLNESKSGSVRLTLRYFKRRETLRIVVHEVANIPARHHLPDSYVKLYLLPAKHRESKRKTQIIKENIHPIFDESFEYSLSVTDLNLMQLEVTVATEKKVLDFGSNVLGQVIVHLNQFNLNQTYTGWFDLKKKYES